MSTQNVETTLQAEPQDMAYGQFLTRLWDLSIAHRKLMLTGFVFRLLQSACLALAVGSAAYFTGLVANGETVSLSMVRNAVLVMFISLVGQLFCGYLSVRYSWLGAYRFTGDLRIRTLEHLRQLPMAFHMTYHRGDISTALTTHMEILEGLFAEILARLVQTFSLPFILFGFLLWLDAKIAVFVILPVIAAVLVFILASRKLTSLGHARQDLQSNAAIRLIEYSEGMPVIRAYNQFDKGRQEMMARIAQYRDLSIKMVRDVTKPVTLYGFIVACGIPVMILVGGIFAAFGWTNAIAAALVLMLLVSLYEPIVGLVGLFEIMKASGVTLNRLDQILNSEPLPTPQHKIEIQHTDIEFDNVDFGYSKDKLVLAENTFVVPANTMTAIVGPSGAGKSTVLNLLTRFWDVSAGAIRIGGTDIRDIDAETMVDLVSVVFQDVHLVAGTIAENIAMGRSDATSEDIESAARRAQAHDFIKRKPNGYGTYIGEGGTSLSGGERQRIAIARAILKDAPIILLDEATAALDPINEKAVAEALAQLVQGKTFIVVAHKLNTIREADQILVLENGHIKERGNHKTLLQDGVIYPRLWSRRMAAESWTFK